MSEGASLMTRQHCNGLGRIVEVQTFNGRAIRSALVTCAACWGTGKNLEVLRKAVMG